MLLSLASRRLSSSPEAIRTSDLFLERKWLQKGDPGDAMKRNTREERRLTRRTDQTARRESDLDQAMIGPVANVAHLVGGGLQAVSLKSMRGSLTEGWSSFPASLRFVKAVQRRPLLSGVVLVVVLLVAYFVTDAPAARAATALAEESGPLSAPADARLVGEGSSHKPGQATFATEYEVSLSYPEIRSFYESELGRHGWSFVSDKPLTDWGGPVIGYQACYRKVEFWAVLTYFNNHKGAPTDYNLDLTWGSSVCP